MKPILLRWWTPTSYPVDDRTYMDSPQRRRTMADCLITNFISHHVGIWVTGSYNLIIRWSFHTLPLSEALYYFFENTLALTLIESLSEMVMYGYFMSRYHLPIISSFKEVPYRHFGIVLVYAIPVSVLILNGVMVNLAILYDVKAQMEDNCNRP